MKKITLLLAFIAVIFSSHAQTYVSGGIYSNTTWTTAGSPYIVTDTVVVFPGITLTVQPGVVVKFDNNTELEIREGTLIALGTPSDSITFTSNSGSPHPGSWNQIYMYDTYISTETSKFSYCNFIYANNGIYNYQTDTVFINHSTFRDNLTGINWGCLYIDSSGFYNNGCGLMNFSWTNVLGSGSVLNACKVTNNNTGIFVAVYTNSTMPNTITNDIIEYNTIGLADLTFSLVNNCVINYNNWGITNYSAGGYSSTVENSIIDSNKVTGISLGFNGDIIIDNKIQYNKTGIDDSSGFESYFGNTIEQNIIDDNSYGLFLHDPPAAGEIQCNSICNNLTYNLSYNGSTNAVVADNYWCLPDSVSIHSMIYDGYTNISYGLIDITPFDTVPCTHVCNLAVSATATRTVVCAGDSTTLTAHVYDYNTVYTAVWKPGNYSGNTFTVAPMANITYTVTVTDSSGCRDSTYIIIDTSCSTSSSGCNLTISVSTTQDSVCSGNPTSLNCNVTDSYSYNTPYWIPGNYYGSIYTVSPTVTTTYTVSVTDINSCQKTDYITIVVKTCSPPPPCGNLYPPSICYVTSDTSSTFNTVVWQKTGMDTLAIDSVIIYRQNILSNYVPIGEVSVHAHTKFNDYTALPLVEPYFYALGIHDTCGGNDTSMSTVNETVFLQSSIGTGHNVVNLNWNFYQGTPVLYYRILRDDSGTGNWHAIDSVQGTINAFSDRNAPVNPGLRYMVNVDWNVTCTPSVIHHRNSSHFIFNTENEAYSNMTYLFPTGIINLADNNSINIFPNPVNDFVSISFNNAFEGMLTITDVLGQNVYTANVSAEGGSVKRINLSNIANGVYFITLEGNGKLYRTKIIKM